MDYNKDYVELAIEYGKVVELNKLQKEVIKGLEGKLGNGHPVKQEITQRDIMGEYLEGAIEQNSLLNESSFFGLSILVLDKENQVSRLNPAFTQFFGYAMKDIYKKNVLDTIVTNGDVGALHAHLSKIDIHQSYLLNITHKEGYDVPVKIRSKTIETLVKKEFKVLLLTVLKDLSDVWPGFMISEGDVETGEVFKIPRPIRAINPYMFDEHYGYSAKEVNELNIMDLIHPSEIQGAIKERKVGLATADKRGNAFPYTNSQSLITATTIEKQHQIKQKDGSYKQSTCIIRTHWQKRYTTIQFNPVEEKPI